MNVEGVVKNGRCLYCFPDSARARPNGDGADSDNTSAEHSSLSSVGSSESASPPEDHERNHSRAPTSAKRKYARQNNAADDDDSEYAKRSDDDFDSPSSSDRKRRKSSKSKQQHIPGEGSIAVKTEPDPTPSKYSSVQKSKSSKQHKKLAGAQKNKNSVTEESSGSNAQGGTEIKDSDGNVFKGTILRGNSQKGYGIFSFKSKEGKSKGKKVVYEGWFENGYMEGHGKSEDEIGCVYEGSFHLGAAHGKGKCTWQDGSDSWTYTGEWVMDSRRKSLREVLILTYLVCLVVF